MERLTCWREQLETCTSFNSRFTSSVISSREKRESCVIKSIFSIYKTCNSWALQLQFCRTHHERYKKGRIERKTEWIMRGLRAVLAKSDYCSMLDVLGYYTTRTGYFCSLLDFFIFVGRCNKVRVSERKGGKGRGPRIPNLISGRKGSEY